MNLNDAMVIVLLSLAVIDTAFARILLPKMLKQNPNLSEENIKQIITAIYFLSSLFAAAAMYIYLCQPITWG